MRGFFIKGRTGARPFAEAMLSLRSKWALLRSKTLGLVGGDDQAHLRHLNEQFSKLVFSDAEFRSTIESAAVGYLAELQAAENELLVKVRADMADIALQTLPAARSDEIFQREFQRIAAQVAPAVAREMGMDAVRELSSLIAGEIAVTVLTNMAARLGVSSGLMLAGVGASWATLGLSIVAAIVVDQVVCWVAEEVRDPAGQLEDRIHAQLADICRLVIDGDGQAPGLRGRLSTFDQARSEIRRTALRELVFGREHPATQPQREPGPRPR